jgi:carboxyl-terminal processing protease
MSTRVRTTVITLSTVIVALLLMGAVLARDSSSDGAYRQLAVYSDVLQRIKSDYVEEPDLKSVTLGAINGLLESIDPFASYLSAEQYKEYIKNESDGYKGGVGIICAKRFGYVGVVDVIPGSPGAKAGLATGDMIESIHGIATRDMPLAYAKMLLQGKPGTTVEISVLAMQHPEPKKVTLTRTVIEYPPVSAKMMQDQVGYLQVQAMTPGTPGQIADAVKDLEKQGARKLILDLRYCGSGTPEEGVAIANLFQDKGLMVYVEGQHYPRKDFEADPAKAITRLPLLVLTNRGTASGAEVAAASLLDSKRAEQVVGEHTYGDASVRQAIAMDDGGAIILSVAKYYSPSGKAIQDVGVTPTVPVLEAESTASADEDEENPPEGPETPAKPGDDPILQKALEIATNGAVAESGQQQGAAAGHQASPVRQMPPNIVQPDTPSHVPAPPPQP